MFVMLSPKTAQGKNTVSLFGAIWFVVKEAETVQFSPSPGPWLLLESRGDSRWVHKNNDTNFAVCTYGEDLSQAAAKRLRQQLAATDGFQHADRRLRRRISKESFAASLVVLGAFVISSLAAASTVESYPFLVFALASLVFWGTFKLGTAKGRNEGVKQGKEAACRELTQSFQERFRKRIRALYTQDEAGEREINLDKSLFHEIRSILRDLYVATECFEDGLAFEIRAAVLEDSDEVAGVTLDPLRRWLTAWDTSCGSSIHELDQATAVHLCEHGSLYISQGEFIKRTDARDTCSWFEFSFDLT